MSQEQQKTPPAPAYFSAGAFHDWYSGAVLERYTGRFVRFSETGERVLMRTWFDQTSGERAVAYERMLEG